MIQTETTSPLLQVQPGTASAGALLMSDASMDKLERLSHMMASGRATVPAHLKGSPGDCFAIALQSMQWGMNPFSVAQKTHIINGTLGYEAQLVAAVINSSGIVLDRFNFEWFGAWDKIVGRFKEVESRTKKDDNGHPKKFIVPAWNQADEQGLGVKVWATLRGEAQPRVLTLLMTQARTRNSTLWTEDPKQQLAYLAQKRWARLHTPDVILGVYTPDELQQSGEIFMGTAEEVPAGEGAPPAAETATRVEPAQTTNFYPQADFDRNLQQWVNVVTAGRKTLEAMLIFIQSKAKLTPVQITAFTDAVKQAQQAGAQDVEAKTASGPVVTDITPTLEAMRNAQTQDALINIAAMCDSVNDPDLRKQLDQTFDARMAELKAQA
ncbi:hypothetical protein A4F85_04775 [Delftia sp. GW456-R20]|uniref:RecT family recombinase n=1 Tax=Delftia sp. GW456-R20 TaxID=1827145 RepID=UPI0007AE87D9|nr:RecT family recombinase [Delftia sp. GW456-R20]KZK32031.1 hypothetical protein A4F85_04775 [Delftia sp. GW456-R20]